MKTFASKFGNMIYFVQIQLMSSEWYISIYFLAHYQLIHRKEGARFGESFQFIFPKICSVSEKQ